MYASIDAAPSRPALEKALLNAGEAAELLTPRAWDGLWEYRMQRHRHVLAVATACAMADTAKGVGAESRDRRAGGELSKVLGSLDEQWIAHADELTRRLAMDRALITEHLSGGISPGKVVGLRAGIGDPHDGGRTTTVVSFESGLRIVYKPRPVALLRAWGRLLGRLEVAAGLQGFVLPVVLDRDRYGWVSWLDERPPADASEAGLLGRRAGFLLAIAYVLGSSDLHCENLLIAGSSPIVVDAETLLYFDRPRNPSVDSEREPAFDLLMRDGVLRTGLLPRWQFARGRLCDASGLGAELAGTFGDAVSDGLMRGFVRGYQVLRTDLGRRVVMLFLEEVRGRPVRVVRLSTVLYDAARSEHLRTRFLGTSTGASAAEEDRVLRILNEAEHAAIRQLDIPRTLHVAAAPRLADANAMVPELQTEDRRRSIPPDAYARSRLHQLDLRDLDRQLLLTRASIALRAPGWQESPALRSREPRDGNDRALRPSAHDSGRMLAAAERLAEAVLRGALRRDGAQFWITCRPVGSARTWRLEPADFGLYDGGVGIALFLAAVGRCSGDSRWTSAATEAARPVVRALCYAGGGPDLTTRFGIGGAEGLGGILYGLALLERLSGGAPASTFVAERFLRTPLPPASHPRELLYGTSGLVLGALAYYACVRDERILERAAALGRTLQAQPEFISTLSGSDPAPGAPRDGGMAGRHGIAHGVAGLILTLARLWHHTRDRSFLTGARELSEAVRLDVICSTLAAEGNASWCNGLAGLLACSRALQFVRGAAEEKDEMEEAHLIDGLVTCTSDRGATLCCGAAGRLDALVTVMQQLDASRCDDDPRRQIRADSVGRGAVEQEVERIAATLAEEVLVGRLAGRLGRRELWGVTAGLYGGISGVGYALLRSVFPQVVPSPLQWQLEEN